MHFDRVYLALTVMIFTDNHQASLISFHVRALASSQPLPSTSLQHLEETESPLIRRHSDQGLPSPHWPASALQPCKKHTLINTDKFTLIIQFYFVHWLTLYTHRQLTVTLLTQSLLVSMQLRSSPTHSLPFIPSHLKRYSHSTFSSL